MWACDEAVVFHCPESELDGETLYWLDLAALCRSGVQLKSLDMIALDFEALLVIEDEWRKAYVNSTK